MLGPSDAVTTIARMIAGKAKTRSVLRMTTGSTQRAEVAGERPEAPPIRVASATSSSASGIDSRAP